MRIILTLIFCFYISISHSKVFFSENTSWHKTDFDLLLYADSSTVIWYTVNGKKPIPGTDYTYRYNQAIRISSLTEKPYRLLNRAEEFASDTTIFHSQNDNGLDDFDFQNLPQYHEVPKKTIIRACVDNCEKIYTRSYGIGDYKIHGWEVEIIFDNPEQVFDKDSGIYSRGPGHKTPWILSPNSPGITPELLEFLAEQPDSIVLANYDWRDYIKVSIPSILWPDGITLDQELFSMPEEVNSTVLFFYHNQFVDDIDAKARPNGNGRLHTPLKSWKIKLNRKAQSYIPFAITGNIILKTIATDGINSEVSYNIANKWKFGSYISRQTDFGVISLYNGEFLESFGSISIMNATDKKYARYFWNMNKPISIRSWGNEWEWLFGEDTSAYQKTFNILKDTSQSLNISRDSLDNLIDNVSIIKKLLHYSCLGPSSSWDKEYKDYSTHTGEKISFALKDGDSFFRLQRLDQNSHKIWNPLAFFLTRNLKYGFDEETSEDIDWYPTWGAYAVLYNRDNNIFYRNLLLDGFSQAYRYGLTQPILNSSMKNFRKNWSLTYPVNKINNIHDSLYHEVNYNQIDSYLKMADTMFLKDFIELFVPDVTLADTFNIYVILDSNKTENTPASGMVKINSLPFIENGTRIHLKNFPVEIKAIPFDGYEFSHWQEYPDSMSVFLLFNKTNMDITLTPQFIKSEKSKNKALKISDVLVQKTDRIKKVVLQNLSDQPVLLSDYCLTDDINIPCKHHFEKDPYNIIEPRQLTLQFRTRGII